MANRRDVEELLERSDLFGVLDLKHRSALAALMQDVTLEPGQLLFSRGELPDKIFLVEEGRVRLSVLSQGGRELSFAHAIRGDVFGEIAALDGAVRSADATAITRVRIKSLPQLAFLRLINTESTVALAVIRLLCARLREISNNYEAMTFHPVEVRLSRLILGKIAEKFPRKPEVVAAIALEMSQSDLALLIGTTRQRANAALARLEKRGAIRRHGDVLQCDLLALQKIARRD